MKFKKSCTKKNKRTRKKKTSKKKGGMWCRCREKKKKKTKDEFTEKEIEGFLNPNKIPKPISELYFQPIPRTTSTSNLKDINIGISDDEIKKIKQRVPSRSAFDDGETLGHSPIINPNINFFTLGFEEALEDAIKKNPGLSGGRRKKKTRKYKGNKYPYKNITKKEAIADFIKLKTTTNPRSLNGLEIVNYGTEKLRVRTKYRGKSLIQRWKDKKARKT